MSKNVPAPRFGRFVKASSRFLAFLALASWLGFIGLFFHYDATRPTVRQPNEGGVYPSNNHGHVVYLSEQDERQLNLLQGAALSLFIIAVVLDYVYRQQITASQIHRLLLSSSYWLCSPASWLASLRELRQYNAESQNKYETAGKLRRVQLLFIGPEELSKFFCPRMHGKTHSRSYWDRRRCTVRYAPFCKNLSGSVVCWNGHGWRRNSRECTVWKCRPHRNRHCCASGSPGIWNPTGAFRQSPWTRRRKICRRLA